MKEVSDTSYVIAAIAKDKNQQKEIDEKQDGWMLDDISFLCEGKVGKLLCDTGAACTVASKTFVERAGLKLRPIPESERKRVALADGHPVEEVGFVDMPVAVQLVLDMQKTGWVTWERRFVLERVRVVDLGPDPPKDLYVSWKDFNARRSEPPPLGELLRMILLGARVLDCPRAPKKGQKVAVARVIKSSEPVSLVGGVLAELPSAPRGAGAESPDATAGAPDVLPGTEQLEEKILSRINPRYRSTPQAKRLLAGLLQRSKIFTDIVSSECTKMVEFEILQEPRPVSFRAIASKRAPVEVYKALLEPWEARGIIEKVAHSEPAYGFAIVVPKAGGKFRLTINPVGVNAATARVDPEGGYMPSSMLREAQAVGGRKYACKLDCKEAFVTLKLGPVARVLATFTTPVGKYRWNHGFFGWHSFPAKFQQHMMEDVVLPTQDRFGNEASVLAWIDDIVAATNTLDGAVDATLFIVDLLLDMGGRLSLDKCEFLVERFDWCGVEVDLCNNEWRIAKERVASLGEIPVPEDREALGHVLGILRYYYFGVADHNTFRAHIEKLVELDFEGACVSRLWTDDHTKSMQAALKMVMEADWHLIYDHMQPVLITTDASGSHGYCVVATQYDRKTGKPRPIAFVSKGWRGPQTKWTAQVKECYAQREAVVTLMPQFFPHANLVLLCDNMNLYTEAASADPRVARWVSDIKYSGSVVRKWTPGERNTIADYGSRAVRAFPAGKLSEEEEFELHIHGLLERGEGVTAVMPNPESSTAVVPLPASTTEVVSNPAGTSAAVPNQALDSALDTGDSSRLTTPVPGHLVLSKLMEDIAKAQIEASADERLTWVGQDFSTAKIGEYVMHLYKDRLMVPKGAKSIKETLLHQAHDASYHYAGSGRTLASLRMHARVHWYGISQDVKKYVRSCFRCQVAKAASHEKSDAGTLSPTIAPEVHHTWYVDLKGPMPHGTGYLLAVVESLTRFVKLRYLKTCTAAEVIEELYEVIWSFSTRPVVIRSDGGSPFDSAEFLAFCAKEHITAVKGVAHHSQGQGMVETRFRPIAAAIMATLGHKAPDKWWEGLFLARLEEIVNGTICEPIHGCPHWAMFGRQPRTALSAQLDWSSANFGNDALGLPRVTYEDYANIIAEHHARIKAIQSQVMLATSVAQMLTKRSFDKGHKESDFALGDDVLLLRAAPNRLVPYFVGPYKITWLSADKNFVRAKHFADGSETDVIHVSRLLHFDGSRSATTDMLDFYTEEGNYVVDAVLGHRQLADGRFEFHIKWIGTDVTTWESGNVKKVVKVINYCKEKGLPHPAESVAKVVPPTATALSPAGPAGKPAAASGRPSRGRGGRRHTP